MPALSNTEDALSAKRTDWHLPKLNLQSRISQVEQKIDGLVASLVKPNATPATVTSTSPPESHRKTIGTHRLAGRDRPIGPGSWLLFPESFEQQTQLPEQDEPEEAPTPALDAGTDAADAADAAHDSEYLEKLRRIHSFGDAKNMDGPPSTSSLTRNKKEPAIDDQKVRDLLSSAEADDLLNAYRSMCITFPFVPIEASVSASQLHDTKPMLFLAIITVAAWNDHKLQRYLDKLYRKELAHYTFIRPRRTIWLLQKYMGQCSQDLRDAQQYPSDAIIGHLLAIRRLDDQIHDYFFTEETIELDIADPRILMNFRFLKGQLDEWKREKYSDEFQILFDLSSAFTEMQLHSVALRPPPPSSQIYTADATRLNALLATLEACKRYFDTFLACPVSEYHILAFSEWFRIPVVVITLARLCIPSASHTAAQWDVKTAHERGRLDLYLESLCYRMKGLSTYKRTQNFHADFYWAMEMIMDMTKTWFMKKIHAKKNASNGIPTPDTIQSFAHGLIDGSGTSTTPTMSEVVGCPQTLDPDISMNYSNGPDPLLFMQDVDFDLDK
ncbi:hypothetical protein N0V90_010744 [Kalmusia sp. IMI 367209]|nr:hypothetical protein N0V90_010744 [Kalmusia sp. IMI 367209]